MIVAIGLYLLATIVGWQVKEWDHGVADAAFVALGVLASAGGVIRGHLLFAEQTHSRQTFLSELRRRAPMLTAVDATIGALLLVEGLLATRLRPVAGVLVIGLGVGILLARLVVEKTTTESAFGYRRSPVQA